MNDLDFIIDLIERSIDDNAENNITWWNIIASWFNDGIDQDRKVVEEAYQWISEYKKQLSEELKLPHLKIKFTNNSWYFIELPISQVSKVPEYFIQKQTMTQVVRYTTDRLRGFELKLQEASSHLFEREYNCFIDIRDNIMKHFNYLYNISRYISEIDYYSNWAYITVNKWYCTPKITEKYALKILWWRHPVIEVNTQDFITNDLDFSKKDFVHVITGPNMWGKSTYLRQNALIILLAHMGYNIPAISWEIPITDKMFSRVWSWDNLFLWQSTFMLEMQEISYILHHSTKKSFVIIDEIGRGTSTYDGMSLAWSILRHNHDEIKAKTLFATHYHEIIDHAWELKGVSNHSVAVGENDDNIVFLRKIIPWGIKKSYGIEVAKLAGIPENVLSEAKKMMSQLQFPSQIQQLSFWEESNLEVKLPKQNEVLEKLKEIDINSLSPIEALIEIKKLQEQVKK